MKSNRILAPSRTSFEAVSHTNTEEKIERWYNVLSVPMCNGILAFIPGFLVVAPKLENSYVILVRTEQTYHALHCVWAKCKKHIFCVRKKKTDEKKIENGISHTEKEANRKNQTAEKTFPTENCRCNYNCFGCFILTFFPTFPALSLSQFSCLLIRRLMFFLLSTTRKYI